MRRIAVLLSVSLAVYCGALAQPVDLEGEYLEAIGIYYEVEPDTLSAVAGEDLVSTDLAVVYGIAKRSGTEAQKVASMYRETKSWAKVVSGCELEAVDFYIMISGKVESRVFSPIFAKFSGSEPHHWKDLTLTDQEIVDLVNLRVLSSHHDYSLFDVMAMKDYGSSWPRINQKVASAKKALLEKMAKDTL